MRVWLKNSIKNSVVLCENTAKNEEESANKSHNAQNQMCTIEEKKQENGLRKSRRRRETDSRQSVVPTSQTQGLSAGVPTN